MCEECFIGGNMIQCPSALVSWPISIIDEYDKCGRARILCNDMQWEGVKTSPGLEAWLFCYVPLHKIRYGVIQEHVPLPALLHIPTTMPVTPESPALLSDLHRLNILATYRALEEASSTS